VSRNTAPPFQDKTEKWKYQTIIRETFMKAGKTNDLPAAYAAGKDFRLLQFSRTGHPSRKSRIMLP